MKTRFEFYCEVLARLYQSAEDELREAELRIFAQLRKDADAAWIASRPGEPEDSTNEMLGGK